MDLLSTTEIKELLSKYSAKPSKGLGQNFLIDKNVLQKIIDSANIRPEDAILEVGPGTGVLTRELAKKCKNVIAVEKDEAMIKILKETLKDFKNIEIINEDILTYKLNLKSYKVIANIPYYLTSPLIRKLLECENQPKEIVLMIQKEVAQRICSTPPNMSLLAVSVQFYANAKIAFYVPKNCFWPAPKIDSAIIKIIPEKKYNVDAELFFKVVKAGFSHPRKQLVNNLTTLNFTNGVKLTKVQVYQLLLDINIKENQRAETLSVSDWVNLANKFNT